MGGEPASPMATQTSTLAPAPVKTADPIEDEEELLEEPDEDDDDRVLTEDDFGDDEDPKRWARYQRWLNDDGGMDAIERNY